MKFLVYFITMSSYIAIHAMRMTLPFLGIYLSKFFGFDNKTLGVGNAISYIILGLGYLWFSFKPPQKKKLTYLIFIIISSLGFVLIPICTLIGVKSIPLFFLGAALFGFFQCTSWSTILELVHLYFKPSKDGFLLGIWGSSRDLGNSFGFIIILLLMYTFHWPWQTTMFLQVFLTIAFAVGIYILPVQEQELNEENQQKQQLIQQLRFLGKHLIKFHSVYILSHSCLTKGLVYGILLWIPLYLQRKGLGQFAGYIPILYSFFSLLGSSLLGSTYQSVKSSIKRYFIFIGINFFSLFTLFLLRLIHIDFQNRWFLILIFGILGFCFSGKLNVLSANESIIFCTETNISPFVWGSLCQSSSFIVIGIFQIIIGYLTSKNQQLLFTVFIWMNVACIFIEIIYTVYPYKKQISDNDDTYSIYQQFPHQKLVEQ